MHFPPLERPDWAKTRRIYSPKPYFVFANRQAAFLYRLVKTYRVHCQGQVPSLDSGCPINTRQICTLPFDIEFVWREALFILLFLPKRNRKLSL